MVNTSKLGNIEEAINKIEVKLDDIEKDYQSIKDSFHESNTKLQVMGEKIDGFNRVVDVITNKEMVREEKKMAKVTDDTFQVEKINTAFTVGGALPTIISNIINLGILLVVLFKVW